MLMIMMMGSSQFVLLMSICPAYVKAVESNSATTSTLIHIHPLADIRWTPKFMINSKHHGYQLKNVWFYG